MEANTDQELLRRHLSQNDREALHALIGRHGPMVYATALRRAPADVDDVTQAVFLLFWKKAGKLERRTSVAGWLYRATTYACRNASKVRRRREHYEREAAMLRKDLGHADGAEIRDVLDDALARLGEKYRQAVILRYLEGLTAEETAARLGLTPKAAAKRAERGIAGLRADLASKGHGAAEVGLAGVLAAEAATALPEAVSAGLMKAVAGGSAGAGATALSVATGKAMAMAKVKLAAAWVGGVALVGVGVGLVAGPESAKAPQMAQAAPPATAPVVVVQKNEADASPRVHRHALLVDQGLCTAILRDATRVPSEGQWETYRMPTAKLREWLIGAPTRRVLYSHEGGPAVATPEKAPNQDRSGFANFYMFTSYMMVDRPYLQVVMRGVIQDHVWADGMGVHFPLKDNDWKVEINGVPGGMMTRSGKLSADAVVQADETLLAVLKVGELLDGPYCVVVAMDVFNATDIQTGHITQLRESELWTQFGPALCRQIANRAAQWNRGGHFPEEAPEKWQRKLGDGTVVRLETVASGRQWPGISWDGDGKPLKGSWTTNWTGEPGKLTMWGHINDTTAPTSIDLNGRTWGEFNKDKPSQWYREITLETKAVQVRVGVGEFANAGSMELHKPIAVGPLKVELRKITKGSDRWQCQVEVAGAAKDRLDYAIAPVVVTRSGLRVGPELNLSERPDYSDFDIPSYREKRPLDLQFIRRGPAPFNQDEFDHLELLWRKAEVVTFADFAAAPAGAEMADLEQAVREARSPEAGKAAAVARAASEEPELAEGQGPADAMQLLVAALNTGNLQEARKYISGDAQMCDTFIDTMTAKRQLLDAIKKRLGTVPDIPALTQSSNIDWELVKNQYKIRADGVAFSEGAICRRGEDGTWRLDLKESFDGRFADPEVQGITQRAMPIARRLTEDLNTGKISTAQQVREAFDAMLKGVREQRPQ